MRFAVIGSPVAHSRSPAMHLAAYRALGMAHTYEKIETPFEELAERFAALRDGTYAGLNVTVPLKTRALAMADVADESAKRTGAANTLVVRDGKVIAHNTDAPALRGELNAGVRGRSAIVLGTGGAARAAVAALAELGAARIIVRARDVTHVDPLRGVALDVAIEAQPLQA